MVDAAREAQEETTALVRQPAAEIDFGGAAANWDHAFRIAKVIADSDDMIPKQYRGQPAKIVVAMQLGAECGMSPMMALQSIRSINGQFGLYGDGFLAVIMASPRYERHEEYYVTGAGEQVEHLTQKDLEHDETKAVSKFWRRGNPLAFTGTFSIADAKRAHLLKKEGPWIEYPQRQLMWRARGFGGRNGFAAELRGMKITAELEDLPRDEPRDEPRVIDMPVRRSERQASSSSESAAPAAPSSGFELNPPASTPTPPAPGEPAKPARAATSRARPPASASSSSSPASSSTEESLEILETQYIAPKDGEAFWEVRARVKKPGAAPLPFVFVTRNKDLYELAASAEGTSQTFTVTWQKGTVKTDQSECKVLTAIAAS
jgi:hypothetical protein